MMTCSKIRNTTVADPGEGPGGAVPLFLYQTEPQRAENMFLRPPPPLPYLRVWMNAGQ